LPALTKLAFECLHICSGFQPGPQDQVKKVKSLLLCVSDDFGGDRFFRLLSRVFPHVEELTIESVTQFDEKEVRNLAHAHFRFVRDVSLKQAYFNAYHDFLCRRIVKSAGGWYLAI